MKKHIIRIVKSKFTKFALGGAITFLLDWLLTIFLTEIFFIPSNISYFISLMLGFIFLYTFHKHFTFKVKSRDIRIFHKFLILILLSSTLNWIGVFVFSYMINYIIVIPLVNIIVAVVTYPLNRDWVFVEEYKENKNKIYSVITH